MKQYFAFIHRHCYCSFYFFFARGFLSETIHLAVASNLHSSATFVFCRLRQLYFHLAKILFRFFAINSHFHFNFAACASCISILPKYVFHLLLLFILILYFHSNFGICPNCIFISPKICIFFAVYSNFSISLKPLNLFVSILCIYYWDFAGRGNGILILPMPILLSFQLTQD